MGVDSPQLFDARRRVFARIAVWVYFFGYGATIANWAVRRPILQHNLDISDAIFGFVLASASVGVTFAIPIAAFVTGLIGTRIPLVLGMLYV